MSNWLLDEFAEARRDALRRADRIQVLREVLGATADEDELLIKRAADALEMAVLDLILRRADDDEQEERARRSAAADAFRLLRALPLPHDPVQAGQWQLRAASLAVLGDMGSDASRWLRETGLPPFEWDQEDWSKKTWTTILDVWLRLIRKDGWSDRDSVLERIVGLRDAQESFEQRHLEALDLATAKATALELVGLYHLARAAEIFAHYMTDGVVEGRYQIHQLLDAHFDRVLAACQQAQMVELEPLSRLLAATAAQMADNSIWTVTRAVNSRVTEFVKSLVDRGRGDRAIFDVLPPQRRTLAERGLLGSSRRAVVVSLPTSSGKTLIAEFRMLQALNQFDAERGWVAYLAPTRTLVNQIARQLRRDFAPLDVIVEQVSPALEIDSIESDLLREEEPGRAFRVLVTTPEKLDLMLRQGWEAEIGRPLTLVIVDEAHNIQSVQRGLKLELLLATINSECQRAQFLLLTPFIDNAREVARWLGGNNSEDISLSLEWQPNDRVIGIVKSERGELIGRRSHDYSIKLETVHTTRQTLTVDELLTLPKRPSIASTYNQASDKSTLAAVAAQDLQERGPVIVMHARADWVWSLADRFKIEANRKESSPRAELVQDFLRLEFGSEFPLVELLSYGVGVHHAGLPDDVRALMEWLFEEEELRFLVATTTIAQGVNFPVSGVVMASHRYPSNAHPFWTEMPPEDFWNIAGRAGRIAQGSLGVVALAASGPSEVEGLRDFIGRQTGQLNSALVALAREAGEELSDLGKIVYNHPEWSTFVQYLAHTYRQTAEPAAFANEVEQVLRNTFGFEKLRSEDSALAARLLSGVHLYTQYMQQPGQPLKLVDSTGFSLQSIRTVLGAADEAGIRSGTWNADSLFSPASGDLQSMMGVLLRVPELRDNLQEVTGGSAPDGDKLALIVKDWVNGSSVPDIARRYFMDTDQNDFVKAMTKCGKSLFGKLAQTAAWGLGALLSITASDLPENEMRQLANLPSRVFYGVNSDSAVALRLLGVPRSAASDLATYMKTLEGRPLAEVRSRLRDLTTESWQDALGEARGETYRSVWRVLEGLD